MQLTSNNIKTPTGDAIAGAQVLVKIGSANAILFSDNGVTPIVNPVVTDANGVYKFFAANGRYNITITSTKLAAPIQFNDVILFDPADSSYNPTIVSDLANQTNPALGAGLVGWFRSITGFFGRTASDKLLDNTFRI